MMKKNDQRKIVMLGHKRVPSREGGVEIVVEELSARMVSAGHQVTCLNRAGRYSSKHADRKEQRREYRGIRIKTVPTWDRKGLAAMTASATGALAAAFGRYDVVHFHAEGPCAMLWLPKLFGKRCITTIHGLDHQRAKWGRFARAYILLGERCAVRFADEIIVLSRSMQQYFRDVYGRETVFIPNGVTRPVRREPELICQQFGLEKENFILFLGRLVPEKGIHYLIEAFDRIHTDKKLVIAGGTSDTDVYVRQLQEMAAENPNILFTGFVQGQVLDELYSNAYLYVIPSDLEGMPLSLLEAMSYGNCCVVSDIPECAEVVEDKAEIFPRGNVEALAECLQALCDDPEHVSRSKASAADFICGKYNWDDVASQTLELYK